MLSIEFEPENQSEPCECCGGKTTSLTRFVYNDGDAYAVYYAKFSNNHPERVVVATVSLGEWGEGSTPDQRVAFALELRNSENEYQVGLIDAQFSPWQDAKTIGRTLSRDEALAHPLVKEAFHVTDHMVTDDAPIHEYLNAS
jgi:Mrp family chromosome partitioning ATPase